MNWKTQQVTSQDISHAEQEYCNYIAFTGIFSDKTMDDILNNHHWREGTWGLFIKLVPKNLYNVF